MQTNARSGSVSSVLKIVSCSVAKHELVGVSRDITGRPNLDDYGRYATLIGSLQPIETTKNRFPQLVSFIGVTNAGKSTIIKMLVNHTKQGETAFRSFPTPVVGSVTNDKVSISGALCKCNFLLRSFLIGCDQW